MQTKVLIVGGVAGGASTAARLRRNDENMQIIMFERGEHISFANCGLPYYIGGQIQKRKSLLVQTPEAMKQRFRIDVRTHNEVLNIFPLEKEVEVRDLLLEKTYRESYDFLVLSPGAAPIVPDIPGVDLPHVFTVRNVPDSDMIKTFIELHKPASAVVIGGGFIGMEMVEVLHELGVKVSLVESSPQVMGALDGEMAAIVHKHLKSHGIDLYLSDRAVSIEGTSQVEQVVLESGRVLTADMVVLGIGVKPETKLAKDAGLSIGSTGGILVNEYLQTSDSSIYAVGDAVQVKDYISEREALYPLAGPANKQGRMAADNIMGKARIYKGTQGTAIVKVMDLVVAVTGSNEKRLQDSEQQYLTCHTHPAPHATYYPGGKQMAMKLLFAPGDGKVLGAQAVGYEGVDKRIDVLATALRAEMDVYDLHELELAYAPPFSSAKDPVNMLGYVASNILEGSLDLITWKQVPEFLEKGALLLDVRTPKEVESGGVPSSLNIPLDDLRERLKELPEGKEILVFCQVGLRSYIASRILSQLGYKVKSISGGYKSYQVLDW